MEEEEDVCIHIYIILIIYVCCAFVGLDNKPDKCPCGEVITVAATGIDLRMLVTFTEGLLYTKSGQTFMWCRKYGKNWHTCERRYVQYTEGRTINCTFNDMCRSQRTRSLRRTSAAARLMLLRVRIQPGTWMTISCECCVLSPVCRSPTECGVSECNREGSIRGLWHKRWCHTIEKKKIK